MSSFNRTVIWIFAFLVFGCPSKTDQTNQENNPIVDAKDNSTSDIEADKQRKKTFYFSGELESIGWIVHGKKDGYWFFLNPDGAIIKEGHYKDDVKADWWKEYFSNGNLKNVGKYKNGKKSEHWKYYYPNEVLHKQGNYADGSKIYWWQEFDSTGALVNEGNYETDMRTGFWKYYESGKLKSEGMYNNNKKKGTWKFYDPKTGKLDRLEEY